MGLKMITKKMMVKFKDNGEVECFCDPSNIKCSVNDNLECKEYVVKFMEIKREPKIKSNVNLDSLVKDVSRTEFIVRKQLKKFETELQKSVKKVKHRL